MLRNTACKLKASLIFMLQRQDQFTMYKLEINLCFALLWIAEYNMPYIPWVGPIIKHTYTKHSELFNERLQNYCFFLSFPLGITRSVLSSLELIWRALSPLRVHYESSATKKNMDRKQDCMKEEKMVEILHHFHKGLNAYVDSKIYRHIYTVYKQK